MLSSKMLRRFLFFLLVSTLLLFAAVASDDSDSDDGAVWTLTDTNFDDMTSEGSWLLEFYAPWCGHCKKLAPVYEEAAKKLKREGTKFRFAKIDATVEKGLASRFQIRSFPTLKFKRGDDFRTYNGGRTVESLLSYAREMISDPVQTISSSKSLKTLTTKHPIVFALFSSSAKSDVALKTFTEVAFRLQGIVKFVHVPTDNIEADEDDSSKGKTAKKLLEKYGVEISDVPAVVVISAGEDSDPFKGPFDDAEALKDYVWSNRMPLISELDGSNFEELTTQGKILMFLILDPKATQQSQAYTEAALPVAKKYKGKYIFASIDGNKFAQYIAQFSVDASKDLPTIVALDYPDYYYSAKEIYPQSGSLPAHQIDDFADAVADGKISASGTIPWYNPQRYFKKLERFLNGLSTVSFVATVILMTVVFVALVFYCCKCLIGFDGDESNKEEEDGDEEEETKKDGKGKEEKKDEKAATASASTESSTAASEAETDLRQRKSKRAD